MGVGTIPGPTGALRWIRKDLARSREGEPRVEPDGASGSCRAASSRDHATADQGGISAFR